MSILNFFSLEKRVYNQFRKASAKSANIKENDILKIRLLFLFDNNKVKVLIYSNKGDFEVIKRMDEFEFSETVKAKAEEVLKDCYEVNIIEANRDFLTNRSENTVYYTSMKKEKKQINFNIF